MASVAHTVPAAVKIKQGSEFGFDQSGLEITRLPAGPVKTRDLSGRDKRRYLINPILFTSSATTLEQWEAFIHQIRAAGNKGWVVESISEIHHDVMCGQLTDGTRTTFPAGVIAPASEQVFVGTAWPGTPQDDGYILHSVSNLLTDAQAECSDAALYTAENGSDEVTSKVSYDGLTSIKITPDGLANPREKLADAITVTENNEYTGVVSVLPTGPTTRQMRVVLFWYGNGGSTYDSASGGTLTDCPAGTWTTLSVTATAPSGSTPTVDAATVAVIRNQDTDTDPIFIDCFAVNRGDYARWHLPSVAPGVVEFSTAPATGNRVSMTATGKRVIRCQFDPGFTWSRIAQGHASVRSFSAIEALEF